MATKLEKAQQGPRLWEVVIGAILSFILGVSLCLLYLILKPVEVVKQVPAPPAAFTVYFVEGSANSTKARQLTAKKKALAENPHATLVLGEDELNSLFAPVTPAAAPPAKDAKPAAPPAPAAPALVVPGALNFRIHDGIFQMGVKSTVNALGFSPVVIMQSQGNFEKQGDAFVFVPATLYIGSLPLHKVPGLAGAVFSRMIAMQHLPDDAAAIWKQLRDVKVSGNLLELTPP